MGKKPELPTAKQIDQMYKDGEITNAARKHYKNALANNHQLTNAQTREVAKIAAAYESWVEGGKVSHWHHKHLADHGFGGCASVDGYPGANANLGKIL